MLINASCIHGQIPLSLSLFVPFGPPAKSLNVVETGGIRLNHRTPSPGEHQLLQRQAEASTRPTGLVNGESAD